jgi:hypothetical protein
MVLRLLLCGAIVLAAQEITGSVTGIVMDPSGAAVPHAKVTIRDSERDQGVRTVTTDTAGKYAVLLPLGMYAVSVEAEGFRTETRTGIATRGGDDLKVDVTLAVAGRTDLVTVHETAAGVGAGQPATAIEVDGAEMREVPLGTRNYAQLAALMPGVTGDDTEEFYIGVSNPSGSPAVVSFSVNGQRSTSGSWTVDGADNADRGGNQSLVNYPSVDAIRQFSISRSPYSADMGRAGAQMNVATQGGASRYHGLLYEYVRNDALSANNWMNNANRVNVVDGTARVPQQRYNDFGFTLSGPVDVPWKKRERNRTFFLYSQEHRRLVNYRTFAPVVPDTQQLHGIFAKPVCVTFSGSTCTKTATTIANIDPVAAAYIKDIWSKLPLSATSNTIYAPERLTYGHDQEMVRIDHRVSERISTWGRMVYDSIPTVEPGGLFTGSTIPDGATTNTNAPGFGVSWHAVETLRPTMLNDMGVNFSRGTVDSTPAGLTSKDSATDIHVNLPYASTLGVVPAIALTGGTTLTGYGPYHSYSRNYNLFDDLTRVKARHTLRVGMTANRYQRKENAAGNNAGTLSFTTTGVPSGTDSFSQSWANFLLGNVAALTQNSKDLTPNLWAWQYEAYVQDDFRVAPRLTLSLGARWSHFGQPTDAYGELDNFDPWVWTQANAARINPATGLMVAGTGQSGNGIIVAGKTSPFGTRVTNTNGEDLAPRLGLAWDPWGRGHTVLRSGWGVYYDATLLGKYEQNIFTDPPFAQSISISNTTLANPSGGTVNVSLSPAMLHATAIPNRTPYTQHWSFDVQHEVSETMTVSVGYFGSKSTHLPGLVDINEAPPGWALAAGLKTGTGTIFTSTDAARINAVRPYLGYSAIDAVEDAFDSNYHSLQATLRKRLNNGGILSAAYTWSRNMTDSVSDGYSPPQNSYNWHEGEYGPAMLDRTQVLSVSYTYPLPFFRQTRGVAGLLLKGWEISGVTAYGTGLPYAVATSNVDPAGLGLIGVSVATDRPDQVCDANANAPHLVSGWFNTKCFAAVPSGVVRPGDAGRATIRGPGYGKWDATLAKNVRLSERFRLQVRCEGYNVPNHPSPAGFGSTNITSSQFGVITSFREARSLQLAGRVTF